MLLTPYPNRGETLAMTREAEVEDNIMAGLPTETLAVIVDLTKRSPTKNEYEIVSEAVSELAGLNALLDAIKVAGGTKELIEAMADEVKRLRTPQT